MSYRALNEPFIASDVLSALAQLMVQGTQLASQSGHTEINGIDELLLNDGPWPALILMEITPSRARIGVGMWQAKFSAELRYYRPYEDDPSTLDEIWAEVDLDLRRMLANIEDNPNLIWPYPTGTRFLDSAPQIDLSSFYDKQIDDKTFVGRNVVYRSALIHLNCIPYVSLR